MATAFSLPRDVAILVGLFLLPLAATAGLSTAIVFGSKQVRAFAMGAIVPHITWIMANLKLFHWDVDLIGRVFRTATEVGLPEVESRSFFLYRATSLILGFVAVAVRERVKA